MPSKSECLQLTLDRDPTPCFEALGSQPCDSISCLVREVLEGQEVDPNSLDTMDMDRVNRALHNDCPKTIHNQDLTEDEHQRVMDGLKDSLNR